MWGVFQEGLGTYRGDIPPIEIIPTDPWVNRNYPVPYKHKDKVRELVRQMEGTGIIKRSTSPYINPLVVVVKPNGDLRVCIDAANFNKIVVLQGVEPPTIQELIFGPREEAIMSTFDLKNGFLQIKLDKVSKYLAFSFEGQVYEYNTFTLWYLR